MKQKLILLLFIIVLGCRARSKSIEDAKNCTIPLGTRVLVKYINKEGTVVRGGSPRSKWHTIQYDNGVYDERELTCDRLTIIDTLNN